MVLVENKTSKAYTTCTLLELIELKVKRECVIAERQQRQLQRL
jgi:hypothetical protein